jgi:hypothetical protein
MELGLLMAEKAGSLHPHHNLSSSAKAGDPCGGRIMAGGARALDLRQRGDDNGEPARMGAMLQHHHVTLPFMGRVSNPNR